jgi:hypothetical protein
LTLIAIKVKVTACVAVIVQYRRLGAWTCIGGVARRSLCEYEDDRRRTQASLVAAWMKEVVDDQTESVERRVLFASNASNEPIFQVRVTSGPPQTYLEDVGVFERRMLPPRGTEQGAMG